MAKVNDKTVESNEERVIRELKLDESELLNSNPSIKAQVKQLIHDYHEVFGAPGNEIGTTNMIEFDIKLTSDAVPVRSKL